MRWPLRKATILHRDLWNVDQGHDRFLPGDVVEFPDPPFYEVDPISRQCRAELQCFRLGEGLSLTPIVRDSWRTEA